MYGLDDLDVDIEFHHAERPRRGPKGVSVDVLLLVNGRPMPDSFVVDAFFDAITLRPFRSDRLPLFTCSVCGIFGCAGYSMEVSCTNEALIWRNRYAAATETLLETVEYWFAWIQVKAVAQSLLMALQHVARANPAAPIYSAPSDWDMRPYLARYAARSAALPDVTPAPW